jgi:RNA polymerase sigma factor (sigma-70 family)
MDDVARDAQLDELMSELAWLKRLAVALVRDESDANDLVQETWLVAAEHAPTDGRPLKPWLSRVALNLVRMRSRSAKRRSGREAAVESFVESSPTPDELVSRVDAQRVVVNEVMRLAEPYRTTVLLHFFQDLSSAEIARRSGIPEGTVRRRLKTALDELRNRLHAEERKTGRAVVGVLAPLAAKQGAAGSAVLGVVVVKKAIAIIVVVVGLLLVGAHFYKRRGNDKPTVAAQLGSGASHTVGAAANASTAHVTVAVADEAGPVANAVVRCALVDGGIVIGKTATDGNASVELAAGEWSIAASAERHEPAATTLRVEAGHDDRARIVLASGGRTVTGVVTDATGGVVAGARIDAAKLDLHAKTGRAVAVAFTDPTGHYKLAVGGGAVIVAASHPAYAAQERYVDLGSTGATANFALVPGGVIEGVVRDAQTKQPVAGAVVYVERDAASLELGDSNDGEMKADGAGQFRFAGLRPGNYDLRARAGARISRAPVSIDLGVAEQQTAVVVLIGSAATIRGKVVDGNGSPVAKVTVHASGAGPDETATSDDTGAFGFEGLSPGRWQLTGTSERYLADGGAIVPLAKTDVVGVVVRVRGGIAVAGHVEPRELCDVEIAQVDPTDAFRHDSMTTGPDGSFRFSPFAPDKATLSARCPNGDEGTSEIVVATSSGDNVVRVAPGGSIEGRIVDAVGKPVDSVMVTANVEGETTTFENGFIASGFKTVSSASGAFEIHGLGAATYRLGALTRGAPMKPKKSVKLALTSGQHAAGVEIVVERPTGTIRGTVIGPDGAAVSDAWIVVHQAVSDQMAALRASDDNGPNNVMVNGAPIAGSEQPPVLSDGHGHFEVTNLLPGKYQVVVEARGGQLRGGALNVTTDADLTIRLASEGALHGTVHGARGPTEMFSVRFAPPGALDVLPPPPGAIYGGSFTDGTFTFPRVDPGDYAIEVTSTDGTGKATVHIATNEDASVDIALAANGTVTGRVVDSAGKPMSGIGAALIPDQPPGKFQIMLHEDPATTGSDGRFQVAGPAGTWTLVILGRTPTLKRGVAVTADKALDVGDVTVAAPSPAPTPAPAPAP